MRPVISAVMIVLGVSVCGALGVPVAGDAPASLLKEVPREQVEALAASIAGRTLIVDWHGTWDHATIQAALDAAESGDTIIVLPSTGSPNGAYVENITIPAIPLTLRSINPDDPGIVAATIIDGNHNGRVILITPGATEATRVDGFTIRNGLPVSLPSKGGGVYCDHSSPTIANNTIASNRAIAGGGIYCDYGSPTIVNNTIISNVAYEDSTAGGGISGWQSSPIISGNTITHNSAGGSWIRGVGSGIYFSGGSPTVIGNTVTENNDGGIHCFSSSGTVANNLISDNHGSGITWELGSPTIANNRVRDNSNGGICCYSSSTTLLSNVITGNRSATYGGVYLHACSGMSTNNTIVGNHGPGIHCASGGVPTIVNTLVVFNSSGIRASQSEPLLAYNCLYGNAEGDYVGTTDPTGVDGNISVDPEFAGAGYGNVHIQPDSPCRDAGDDTVVPAGRLDMDGEPRIQNGRVDIGADESDGTVWTEGPPSVVRVRPDGHDANDGSDWMLAKRTVQAGIDAVSGQGGDVWVAAGIYLERLTLRPYVHVYGGFAGAETVRDDRDSKLNITILDGQAGGSVVTCLNLPQRANTIDGFTIRNGTGTSVYHDSWGEAMCGAGVYCSYASPAITNNTIIDNNLQSSDLDHPGLGAGIYCYFASPVIANNAIINNIAAGEYTLGGGVYCETSSPAIVKNRVEGNHALGGGGIWCQYESSPPITSNVVVGNTAGVGAGIGCFYDSSATIVNTVIARNAASGYLFDGVYYDGVGGGLYSASSWSPPQMANSTVVGNSASQGGAVYTAVGDHGGSYVIANTIVAFNSSGIYDEAGAVLDHSCVFGNTDYNFSGISDPTGSGGNISADPLFRAANPGPDCIWGTTDDVLGDLRLEADSPCLDAANNARVPADSDDLDDDGDLGEPLPFDLAGWARFFDDPDTIDTGAGTPPIVDMGAYEFFPTAKADFDADGDVDGDDLTVFEACATGPAIPYNLAELPESDPGCTLTPDGNGHIAADFDEDNDVDQSDFGSFQRCYSGAGSTADSACAD